MQQVDLHKIQSFQKVDRLLNNFSNTLSNFLFGTASLCPYIILPACAFAGESNLQKIQENVRSAIKGKMSMFCLGFGNDADYSFLDVLCRQNKGLARRIFEGSDATLQLQVE